MEMHLVHINKKYLGDTATALAKPDGLAVIGIMFVVGGSKFRHLDVSSILKKKKEFSFTYIYFSHFSQSLMPLKIFIKIPMLKLMLQLYSRNFWMKSVRDIIPMMVPWPRQLATKLLPGSLWKRLLKSLKIRWNIWFMIFKCHEKWFASLLSFLYSIDIYLFFFFQKIDWCIQRFVL